MKKVSRVKELQRVLNRVRGLGKPIRLVPTMGYLHEGHLTLIRAAKQAGGFLVVTIFVNPLQFGPKEDFKKYPRDLARDTRLLKKEGVDLLFCPQAKEIYPQGFSVSVMEEEISKLWCGAFRPGHFNGVLTVVGKLFQLIQPKSAYFGQKDFQQCFLIQKMCHDLFYPIEIKQVPTVREKDGLAMSSRNAYLSSKERKQALCLFQGLQAVRKAYLAATHETAYLKKILGKVFSSYPQVKMQYLGFASGKSLKPISTIKRGDLVLLAAFVGKIRLIDNWIVGQKI